MKRGFSLIEMLIVVAIMAILMSIVVRIGNVSGDASARSTTVVKLQKLENCLSGYYAAFGSYPQVKLHGSRDISLRVEDNVQTDENVSSLTWASVNAACRSQPVNCEFPFPESMEEQVKNMYRDALKEINDGKKSVTDETKAIMSTLPGVGNPNDFNNDWHKADWRSVQIFKFGLLSYLLPRYLLMMSGPHEFYRSSDPCAQWGDNNHELINPFTGTAYSGGNDEVRQITGQDSNGSVTDKRMYASVANMPTQAACARWMPNLAGICWSWQSKVVYGYDITDLGGATFLWHANAASFNLYKSPSGHYYILDSIACRDGWSNEFYYYSPEGFQSYTLWSAGANGKTFPPWTPLKSLNNDSERKTAQEWMADDIIRMRN